MGKSDYKGSLFEKAAEKFDLPGEAASNLPVITVTGSRKVHIENHRGIIGYTDEEISINCGRMIVQISGTSLVLKGMTDAEVLITGNVQNVHFGS